MGKLKKKGLISIFFGLVLAFFLLLVYKPVKLIFFAMWNDQSNQLLIEENYANDVSNLNKTKIHSTLEVSSDSALAVRQIIDIIQYARINKLPVSIAGNMHSMGGHTIAPNGVRINMLPFNSLSLDTVSGILTVGSGALWSDIIPFLNQYGRAVGIMQSDNAFSVGGSVSVNCHGWQHNKPPISSSVVSFRIINAMGELIRCSRHENSELFSLALGGFGLFGVILDAEIATVPNEIYTYHRIICSSEKYLDFYEEKIDKNDKAALVYGRLSISKDRFLENAMLNYFEFRETAPKNALLPEPDFTELKRSVFLSSKEDDYGKRMRWNSERIFSKSLIGKSYSRNQIMNESPEVYLNSSTGQTDILHEYFIPRRNFNLFIKELQKIIPEHKADLLNVTIRNVYKDDDAFLNYSKEEIFAFVMFFNQRTTDEAERGMERLTSKLIDAAINLDGSFYLPYRLHASREQILRAYPNFDEFIIKKKQYDPEEIFQNKFYIHYKE